MSAMLPADRVLLERLGARVRELREAAALTQEALGERAGFGAKYIGEIEKGLRDVPLSTLRAIAEHGLGVPVGALFDGAVRRVPRASHARDVELTAVQLAEMPLKTRRAISALVKSLEPPKKKKK